MTSYSLKLEVVRRQVKGHIQLLFLYFETNQLVFFVEHEADSRVSHDIYGVDIQMTSSDSNWIPWVFVHRSKKKYSHGTQYDKMIEADSIGMQIESILLYLSRIRVEWRYEDRMYRVETRTF